MLKKFKLKRIRQTLKEFEIELVPCLFSTVNLSVALRVSQGKILHRLYSLDEHLTSGVGVYYTRGPQK